jgi:hypothetical protein
MPGFPSRGSKPPLRAPPCVVPTIGDGVRCESECVFVRVISYTQERGGARDLASRTSRLAHARSGSRHRRTPRAHDFRRCVDSSTCPKPLLTVPFIRMRVFDFEHGAVGPDATQRERAERSGRALSRHVSAFASTLLSRSASAPEISKPTCGDSLWRSTTGSRVAIKKSDESQAPDVCAAQSSAARQRR